MAPKSPRDETFPYNPPVPKTAKSRSPRTSSALDPEALAPMRKNGNKAAAALTDPDKPLTQKQRDFVKLWASGETVLNASVRAGYENPSIAYRMIVMPNVLRLYEEEKAKYEEAAQMTREKAMGMLLEAYDMGKLMSDPHAMVSATREVIKMCGYAAPVKAQLHIHHSGSVKLQQMREMTDAELAAIVGKDEGEDVLLELGAEAGLITKEPDNVQGDN